MKNEEANGDPGEEDADKVDQNADTTVTKEVLDLVCAEIGHMAAKAGMP